MDNSISKVESSELFKKNSKGEIVIVGSGKYLRDQKKRFSAPTLIPFEELYKQQVNDAIKDSSEKLRACFSL